MRGTGDGLRWGMGCEVGGECIAHCGRTSALRGGAEVLGKGVSLCGAREGLRRGMGCAVGGKCIAQPAGVRRRCVGVHRRCVGERKCSGRACRCAGAGEGLRRGMGREGGGFNALSPQQLARTRIIIYVRPAHAVKSRPWGRKTPPASTHRPRRLLHPPRLRLYFRARVHTSSAWPSAFRRMTFAPAAPAFTLPPHTLRRRPRRLRPPAAAVIHNGLSTEKLSTSLLAALCKTFSPSRLRTRIYNISFARRPLPGSVRAAVGKRSHRCDPVSRAGVRRVGEG